MRLMKHFLAVIKALSALIEAFQVLHCKSSCLISNQTLMGNNVDSVHQSSLSNMWISKISVAIYGK